MSAMSLGDDWIMFGQRRLTDSHLQGIPGTLFVKDIKDKRRSIAWAELHDTLKGFSMPRKWSVCHEGVQCTVKVFSMMWNCSECHENGPRGLTFTWWGCCGSCQRQTNRACPFLLICSCVYLCLYGPFNCISFHKCSRKLSAFSLCSSGLLSALLVLSTAYLFMKVSLSPHIILCGWLGLKH